ncbi:ER-golgi trafficking TRAPP I complex 85 kDa subunit-domain-containing protein [Abortiporus biennis]|nr:ER-golgi trafficking TRAPP I complex 85 kDa subunit-domain-containing protein [Abortiporus biennis]
MAPALPFSLSPHICILQSPDLVDLLESASLPPLPQLLQSFSPLSQITTRTTSLTSVPHQSFALRFSDFVDIETNIHEDEEQRAMRTIEWVSSRVGARCAKWVDLVESSGDGYWKERMPWWDEMKRCIEGDHVPNKHEGWNHPVAVIYAVSTMAANPLQALQDLHSRIPDLPPWVDNTYMRYSLIVHPSNSPLAEPIAEALFNAVKKQYGLQSHMLSLQLPVSPLPAPVPVPSQVPRLPSLQSLEVSPIPPPQNAPASLVASLAPPRSAVSPAPPRSPGPSALTGEQQNQSTTEQISGVNTVPLSPGDIQVIGRFVREFLTMSLIPWMEKCVVEWNEMYSSSRRLPSRLFSSTRRLFGSSYASAPPTAPSTPSHGSSPSISSNSSRVTSHHPNSSVSSLSSITSAGGIAGGVSQHRRLAEFATILGDYKLAVSVWETLRKDSKGGSDILPLLLAPSPALALHAANAINALHSQLHDNPAQLALRTLLYAVRWDTGIDHKDLLGNVLEGERWLVHAAGNAEEPPAAILLSHAANITERKQATRRAALWYLFAADRLEKSGIKPLAKYFFRKAHRLYLNPPEKTLSPSFWDAEGTSPLEWRGFSAILAGIDHELGRLLYTTGDTEGAVRHFLELLQGSPTTSRVALVGLGVSNGDLSSEGPVSTDKVYLEDFRVAFKHFIDTEGSRWKNSELKLKVSFCQVKHTRIRLPGDSVEGDNEEWGQREDDWASFWKSRGKEWLEKGGKAAVDETFWVDLVIHNPLNVDITFSGMTVSVQDSTNGDTMNIKEYIDVEVIDDIHLSAKETRTIPIAIKCKRRASLAITHARYDFLGLLPASESLAIRGKRLHNTPHQRQNKVYSPDILLKVEVEDASQRLQAAFVDDRHLVLAQGENKTMTIAVMNTGSNAIGELWVVAGAYDEIWVDQDNSTASSSTLPENEVFISNNLLTAHRPYCVDITRFHDSTTLPPGETMKIPIVLHAPNVVEQDLCLLIVFREGDNHTFHSKRLVRHYEVRPILELSASFRPSQSSDHSFSVDFDVSNSSNFTGVQLSQITTMSPTWECKPLIDNIPNALSPRQVTHLSFAAQRWEQAVDADESTAFVAKKLRAVLHGDTLDPTLPPEIQINCRHISMDGPVRTLDDQTKHLIHYARRSAIARRNAQHHIHIPTTAQRVVFPLYHPFSLDFAVFWNIPSQGRSGMVLSSDLLVGAGHAKLTDLLREVETAKVKRSMYAETRRERMELIDAIRDCEWNSEMNPITVSVMDDGVEVQRDFSQGPCHVPVSFALRNHSTTNSVRFALKLSSKPSKSILSGELLPPQFVGRLTHHGELEPSQSTVVRVKLSVSKPGIYALNGYRVESQVLELDDAAAKDGDTPGVRWRVRSRYEQGPQAGDRSCIVVTDTRL